MRVAFQGELGAYSEEAVARLFGDAATPVPCRENRDVTRAIAAGDADAGVLPLENSLAGTVTASYDAMLEERGLVATSECTLPIHHCLLAPAGASLDVLRTVESHPVALAQCLGFFARHPRLVARAAYDTAGAARDVAAAGDPARAAIAGRAAARRYGLEILAADIEDRGDNRTRFIGIQRSAASLDAGTPARTLLLVTTDNVPGALMRVLRPLAERALNMTKLESRPTGEPWAYRFVVEFEHAAGDPAAREVVEEIGAQAMRCESLGTVALVRDS
jgi:prephenate dehydratase